MRDTAAASAALRGGSLRHVRWALFVGICLCGQQADAAPAGDRRAEAAAAVESAARAYAAGDHAAALAGFERAMTLRPSPKIHYNIAVCRQQLMLDARDRGEATAEAEHAAAAVEAYKAYLYEVPGAEDRIEVEATIRDLGGTPQSRLKPIPLPTTEATLEEPPVPLAPPPPQPVGEVEVVVPQPQPQPQPPIEPVVARGRVGAGLGMLGQPQVGTRGLDGAVQGFVMARLGGFVGARRRVYLGGAGLLAAAGQTAADKLALQMQAAMFEVEYGHPLGRARRVELVAGGFLVGARETLRMRADATRPICAAEPTSTLVSQRGGGGAGGRLGFVVLLGARKAHEIGVRLSSAILGFGKGTAAAGCAASSLPFAGADVPRARWLVLVDAGYSFRF